MYGCLKSVIQWTDYVSLTRQQLISFFNLIFGSCKVRYPHENPENILNE